MEELKPKYFVISVFEVHHDWMRALVQNNPDKFVPVQGYLDSSQQKAVLVIYEIKY